MIKPFPVRGRIVRGFTLVEVMVATAVATFVLLGILAVSFQAYKLNHKARLRDNARAVLRTFVEQFERLDTLTTDKVPRLLFRDTLGKDTGLGLRWGELSDQADYPNAPTRLDIDIGPSGSPQLARVTRNVSYINPSNGQPTGSPIIDAAGYMLSANFKITYKLAGTKDPEISLSISVLRLVSFQ